MPHLLPCFALSLGLAFPRPAFPGQVSPSHSWAQVPGENLIAQNLDWEDISSEAHEQPAATAITVPGPGGLMNRIDVFFRDAGKCIRHYQGTDRMGNFAPTPMSVPCGSGNDGPLAAVAWDNSGRIDLFWFRSSTAASGMQYSLMHLWSTEGTTWHDQDLGHTATTPALVSASVKTVAAAPTAASWGTGHIDVFWRDTKNQIQQLGFDSSEKGISGYTSEGWFAKERVVQSNVAGNPAAVESSEKIINLLWMNSGGTLFQWVSDDGGMKWTRLGEYPGVGAGTSVSATSWRDGRIDVVYRVDASHLGHWWFDHSSDATTSYETLVSDKKLVGEPVVVSAQGRTNRLDVFASSGGGRLNHTLYQKSVPGFAGVGEGANGGNGLWCWASAAIGVVNFIAHPDPSLIACDGVNKEYKMTTCCSANSDGLAPAACRNKDGGNIEGVLDAYGISYTKVKPLTLQELQLALWAGHQPVIAHHDHSDGRGHYVDLVDTYHLHGNDMVVIFSPQLASAHGGYWVEQYSVYLDETQHKTWWPDGMAIGFRKQ